jgi:zinc transport system substrate-binding protein
MNPIIGTLLAAGLVLSACGSDGDPPGSPGRTQVVTAFYPLAFLAERIGGRAAEVTDLTPAGAEPHDLELTASQVGALIEADLVIYLGEGFQPAVEDVITDLEAGRTLDVLSGRELLEADHSEDEHDDEGDEHEEEEAFDPHLWLSPTTFAGIAQDVGSKLAELDPANAGVYEDNTSELLSDLESLDADFQAGLADCDRREIIVSHAAFGYLTEEYGLEQVGIAGIDPEAEPTPRRLAEVARFARDNDVSTVFFEELVSPDVAETLASEVGIETEVLNPLESRPAAGDYLSEMRQNLSKLEQALDCE